MGRHNSGQARLRPDQMTPVMAWRPPEERRQTIYPRNDYKTARVGDYVCSLPFAVDAPVVRIPVPNECVSDVFADHEGPSPFELASVNVMEFERVRVRHNGRPEWAWRRVS